MSSNELNKEVRDELRMTAAMRCYSLLRSGGSKSLNSQYDYMSSLYHGDEPSIPSNIKMLCDGSFVYKELYDIAGDEAVVSKSSCDDSDSRTNLSLKVSLSRNKSRMFFVGTDILRSDLEKKEEMVSSQFQEETCMIWQKEVLQTIVRPYLLHPKNLILIL